MIKREIIIICLLLTALLMLFGVVVVTAEDYKNYGIYVNNKKLEKEISVYVIDGFCYIPLYQLKNYLGITINEDKKTNEIIISDKSKSIKIINKNLLETSSKERIKLDTPIVLKENDIYFPLITMADQMGFQVEVMDDIKCIRIKTSTDSLLAGKLIDGELNKTIIKSEVLSSPYPRTAYLTFDDGIDSKITPIILDILKKEDVKATFFVLGNTIEKKKDILQRIIDEGHSIGNHTYSHRKEKIYSSAEGLLEEINKTNQILYNMGGINTFLFRPPYGGAYIAKEEYRSALTAYRTILWNVDSMDSRSKDISSSEILSNVIKQVKNKKSAVIIMHDSSTHIETAKALPDIIEYLKENEFTILPIK